MWLLWKVIFSSKDIEQSFKFSSSWSKRSQFNSCWKSFAGAGNMNRHSTYMYIALLLQHMVIYFSGKNTKINQSTSNCNIKFSLRWVFIILKNFNLAWIQLNVYCCFCWNLFNIWMYQIPKGKMYQSYLIWQDTIGL